MRLVIAIGVAVLAIEMSASAAQLQDDLTRILPDNPSPITVSFSDAPVEGILDMLANAGGFEVYFSAEVKELPPVTLRFKGAFYEDALRGALKITGVRYRVVDGALLISVRPRSEVF